MDRLPIEGKIVADATEGFGANESAALRTGDWIRSTSAKTPVPHRAPDDSGLEFPLLNAARQPRTRLPFWIVGNILLMLALGAQVFYFYGAAIAKAYPPLGHTTADACRFLGCKITPLEDVGLIDLEEAQVAPHPKFDNALRVKVTLVNRASYVQPYPLLEVTLSDNNGAVLARRAFRPDEYLNRQQKAGGMPPQVAIRVSFDITSPNRRAVGYEIQLFASS
ncbi:MAG: DUF3426 domain-containing protein [Acidiferrobacterales bacterium]